MKTEIKVGDRVRRIDDRISNEVFTVVFIKGVEFVSEEDTDGLRVRLLSQYMVVERDGKPFPPMEEPTYKSVEIEWGDRVHVFYCGDVVRCSDIGYLFSDGYRLFRFGDYDKFEEDPYGYNTPFGIKGEKLKYAYLVKEDVK